MYIVQEGLAIVAHNKHYKKQHDFLYTVILVVLSSVQALPCPLDCEAVFRNMCNLKRIENTKIWSMC